MKSINMPAGRRLLQVCRLGSALSLALAAQAASANPPLLPPRAMERL